LWLLWLLLQAADVQHAFDEHRKILICASQSAKPADADFGTVLAGLSKAFADVQVCGHFGSRSACLALPFPARSDAAIQPGRAMQGKKDNRSKVSNQLAFVSEAIQALSWVTVTPAPVPFVKEMAAAGDFYGNKVLTEFKGKYDPSARVASVAYARLTIGRHAGTRT
jgi:hypothetical protein